jgi:hypothetical protein
MPLRRGDPFAPCSRLFAEACIPLLDDLLAFRAGPLVLAPANGADILAVTLATPGAEAVARTPALGKLSE